MTTAPKYPLEHAHTGDENPFDLIDTNEWGTIERWRAVALETGSLGAMSVINKQLRADSAAVLDSIAEREEQLTAREEACDAREAAHKVSVSNFVDFVGKASVLFDRLHQLKADAEEGPLPSPPGSDEVSAPGAQIDPSQEPDTGELPGQEPGEDEHIAPHGGKDQSEFPDPQLPHPPEQPQPISPGFDDV